MEYYFNNLDATTFQRLINGILVSRFGEDIRLTPLRGRDGGRDGETAPGNPNFEFQYHGDKAHNGIIAPPRPGRYLFQVKHHTTSESRSRQVVLSEFERELKKNVLSRTGNEQVNYFFLITNVSSSDDALAKLDKKRAELLSDVQFLHADVWWYEQIVAHLDQMPSIWSTFPEMFAGAKVPFLAKITENSTDLPKSVYMAIDYQYNRDSNIKFRQVNLNASLSKLFTDLDINLQSFSHEEQQYIMNRQNLLRREIIVENAILNGELLQDFEFHFSYLSVLDILLNETESLARKIILEGGPGQGKSTITQMATQIYRQQMLKKSNLDHENRWQPPSKTRLPFRIELRTFADWLSKNSDVSLEEYLANVIKKDSGGNQITVNDIHSMIEKSPVLLVFDGLDEVGSDELRDEVIAKISECIYRFETNLLSDLRVIITTRPPAIVGRREHLVGFRQFPIAPLNGQRIKDYMERWLAVQLQDEDEKRRIRESFEERKNEPHVQALAKNPMQLSVLLHFIQLKGEAFPDRRAELYKEYFQKVIDRDVEKSPELRKQREVVEALHKFLGYKIHALTEDGQADGTIGRLQLFHMVESWLKARGNETKTAPELFKLGEERLGLIVALKGEGQETRYGYEIQPIREYFAAAFINDHVEVNAHDIFPEMVRRSYWREVALFLAGLRRPNEKADLIARSREIDNDEKLGWRQDGRTIVLQLLQEGVFSDPPHVFSEALNFIIDLLDVKIVNVQNEPKDLLEAIPSLIKQSESKRHIERFSRLLQEYNSVEDELVIYRFYRVASKLFSSSEMRQLLMNYQGKNPYLLAKIRLFWPSNWEIDMSSVSKFDSYWQGVPDPIWVDCWWATILNDKSGNSTNLIAPHNFHQYLVEQFATNPLKLIRILTPPRVSLNLKWQSDSNWAIWQLLQFQRIFYLFEFSNKIFERKSFKEDFDLLHSILEKKYDLDFTGLDYQTQQVVADMISISKQILTAMFNGEGKLTDVLESYILITRKYLKWQGLASWIACRCAIRAIELIYRVFYMSNRRILKLDSVEMSEIQNLIEIDSLKLLMNEIQDFYIENDKKANYEKMDNIDFFPAFINNVLHSSSSTDNIPMFIRLHDNNNLIPIVDILMENICSQKKLPFDWMNRIKFSSRLIRPLVDKCNTNLPNLLIAFSKLDFIQIRSSAPLLVSDMQRILKIVRQTDDSKVLVGAIVALSTSKFISTAGSDVLLKMIKADQDKTNFARKLFARGEDELNENDMKIIYKVASDILKIPSDYTFRTIEVAASYLANHLSLNLPSLMSKEDPLRLQI